MPHNRAHRQLNAMKIPYKAASPVGSAAHVPGNLTLLIYALPNITYAIAAFPLALFIPSFYADELGLPLAGVGIAIGVSRILDVLTDPLIGSLSDRTDTRWGRRKPWIVCGAPLLMVSVWMIFVPAENVSVGYLLAWCCLLYFGFTLLDLPYKAWGAELSTDYGRRTRVTAWREGFGFLGQLVFIALILYADYQQPSARAQLYTVALFVVLTLPCLLALSLWHVPTPAREELAGPEIAGWRSLRIVLENPAFLRMIISVLFFIGGLIVQATLHRLVLTHIIGQPELFPIMLLIENIITLLAIPLWVRLADALGKHRALTLAATWTGLWSMPLVLFDHGQGWPLVAVLVIRGSSFASILVLANSMAADVIDHDTVESGRQRSGLYFSIWGMTSKLAIALGIFLATTLPAAFGFQPSGTTHSEASLLALQLVYGALSGVMMTLGGLVLWRFPITRERQLELRRQITRRREEQSTTPVGENR